MVRCGQYERPPPNQDRCPTMLPHFTVALQQASIANRGGVECCPCCGQYIPVNDTPPCPATLPGCPAANIQKPSENRCPLGQPVSRSMVPSMCPTVPPPTCPPSPTPMCPALDPPQCPPVAQSTYPLEIPQCPGMDRPQCPLSEDPRCPRMPPQPMCPSFDGSPAMSQPTCPSGPSQQRCLLFEPPQCPGTGQPTCPMLEETPTCPPQPSRDNRGALRPDIRDCPALGRNFCVHDPAQPFTTVKGYHNYPSDFLPQTTNECDIVRPRGLLRAAVAIGPQISSSEKHKPFCAPSEHEYKDTYCGVSGTNFPMYCAASAGIVKLPDNSDTSSRWNNGQKGEPEQSRCPAADICCMHPPFGVDNRGDPNCCVSRCVQPDVGDPDVARRVGGYRQSMPSPNSWI